LVFSRALGQTHSLTSFGLGVGSCGLAMCVAVERWLIHLRFKKREESLFQLAFLLL